MALWLGRALDGAGLESELGALGLLPPPTRCAAAPEPPPPPPDPPEPLSETWITFAPGKFFFSAPSAFWASDCLW